MFKQYKGGSYKVLSESGIKQIHEATVYLMGSVGIRVHNPRAREIFADHGALVDHGLGIVKMSRANRG